MTDLNTIKLIVFDVDGVLTDGTIILDDLGRETKRFFVRDGLAIRAAIRLGIKVGVITGRSSRSVTLRMAELGVDLLMQGCSEKMIAMETLCQRAGVMLEEAAYVGDDLVDLRPMLQCGYPIAVADAAAEIIGVASYVTTNPGGRGAAREAVEHILKARGQWDTVVDEFGI